MKDSKNGVDNLAFEKEKNDLDNEKKYESIRITIEQYFYFIQILSNITYNLRVKEDTKANTDPNLIQLVNQIKTPKINRKIVKIKV